MYQNPVLNAPMGTDGLPMVVDARQAQDDYEDFYEDIFEEFAKYGQIENLNVCDNLQDHMVGNVYLKYMDEESAAKCLSAMQGRFYNGRPVMAEFSPVTDFREATCRQYEENTCNRGGYCNFMHLKPISKSLRKVLFGRYKGFRPAGSRERSRSPARRDGGNIRMGGGGRRGGGDRGASPRRGRRDRSPKRDRDGSAERRARIAQWNREKLEGGHGPAVGIEDPSLPPPPPMNM